jgi:hypothetical protein
MRVITIRFLITSALMASLLMTVSAQESQSSQNTTVPVVPTLHVGGPEEVRPVTNLDRYGDRPVNRLGKNASPYFNNLDRYGCPSVNNVDRYGDKSNYNISAYSQTKPDYNISAYSQVQPDFNVSQRNGQVAIFNYRTGGYRSVFNVSTRASAVPTIVPKFQEIQPYIVGGAPQTKNITNLEDYPSVKIPRDI